MKKVGLYALLGTLILSSCTLEKRHYRSGFYVNFNRNDQTEVVHTSPEQTPAKTTVLETENTTGEIFNAPNSISEAPEISTVAITDNNFSDGINTRQIITSNNVVAPSQTKSEIFSATTQSHSASDPNFPGWAYIIIALFIPPLAVALKYGVHKAFWLCLIFTLLGFVPGLVYALVYYALQGDNPEK